MSKKPKVGVIQEAPDKNGIVNIPGSVELLVPEDPIIEFTLEEGVAMPKYATSGSAAFDLRAKLDVPFHLMPGKVEIIPTGIRASFPASLALLIIPRSGQAKKHLAVGNSPGLVDSDYRGKIGMLVLNTGTALITINPDERIAQGLFVPTVKANFMLVNELDETSRGAGGFGSTGKE